MTEKTYQNIEDLMKNLKLNMNIGEFAKLADRFNLSETEIDKFEGILQCLDEKRKEAIVSTCLRLSRLPLKEPKTFDGFNFDRLHGSDVDKLRNLSTLTPLYQRRNVAFIGQQGIGKSHLAMAFGRECCERGIKT
jgi:DNA replication protein DnaC